MLRWADKHRCQQSLRRHMRLCTALPRRKDLSVWNHRLSCAGPSKIRGTRPTASSSHFRKWWISLINARWVEWLWNRRVEYWAIRSSVRSFARTAHSLTHSRAHRKVTYVYKLNASISYSFSPLCNGGRLRAIFRAITPPKKNFPKGLMHGLWVYEMWNRMWNSIEQSMTP